VILVDFWTYTCINWLRTQPYLRALTKKYKDKGLIVIGVHTPEFRFEKNIDNVRREAKALHVDYPVAVDSEYVIWRAFNNNYWPALYFIDAQAPALSFRGGLVRTVGDGHSALARRGRR
ncbi:MAG: thioredoxin-like domain-containing protein, partial [Pseudolabrys sp.]